MYKCINTFKSFSFVFHPAKRLVRKPWTRALLIGCEVHSSSASELIPRPNPGNSTACSFSLWAAPGSWRQITVPAFAELDPGLSFAGERHLVKQRIHNSTFLTKAAEAAQSLWSCSLWQLFRLYNYALVSVGFDRLPKLQKSSLNIDREVLVEVFS